MSSDQPTVMRRSRWVPGRPVDLTATWGTLRRGGGDPTWQQHGDTVWRGVRTALGPVTLQVRTDRSAGAVEGRAWGTPEATGHVLGALPEMLGSTDDPTGFRPHHPVVAQAWAQRQGWRVPRTGMVLEALVPAVIEQKVTGQEAFAGQRHLVRRFGEPAPGPGRAMGLWVAPTVATLRRIPSWEWARLGVTPQRADTLMRVLAVADRLEEAVHLPPAAAQERLTGVTGVGVWTAAETAQRALGDADAVSFGDYHVAANIGWALTGSPVDDEELAELLAPYAGHRYRVQRLLELAGHRRPRRGPRMPPRAHLPVR
ncbi:DNA-3-methyladenine glycosylase family protein [Ornithinicoccus hortensis]|nr:DNA-3-methyladenine glycosylase 2 family protein [Ornithinicoccus hortensis]